MEKQKISLNTRLLCADAAGFVEALADGLKERCLKIQKGDETLVLTPPEAVDVEVEAKIREGRGKFSLEISWRIPDDETVAACDEVANLPGRDHLVPPGCADVEDVTDIDLDVALRKGKKPEKDKDAEKKSKSDKKDKTGKDAEGKDKKKDKASASDE